MAITINGKTYRNLQEQVKKNQEDIEEIQERFEDGIYTKEEADAKFQTQSGMSSYVTNRDFELTLDALATGIDQALDAKQDTLVSGTNIKTINGNSILGSGNIVISEESSTAGTGIDITNNVISVDTDVVVTKDANNNVDGILQVERLQSESWDEDDDNKANIFLTSGLRKGRIALETDGEESGSFIILEGTSAEGSEGIVKISGKTKFNTDNRITVTDSNDHSEDIAYLSDIPTVTTYTAGSGINISSGSISVDSSVVTTSDLATVATSGNYNDLSNKPTAPVMTTYEITVRAIDTNSKTMTFSKVISTFESISSFTISKMINYCGNLYKCVTSADTSNYKLNASYYLSYYEDPTDGSLITTEPSTQTSHRMYLRDGDDILFTSTQL